MEIKFDSFIDFNHLKKFISANKLDIDINNHEFGDFPMQFNDFIAALKKNHFDDVKIHSVINLINKNNNIFEYNLSDRFFSNRWPDPNNIQYLKKIDSEYFWDKNIPIIDKNTKIVSLGSCFAFEIAKWLQQNNFNYVVKEKNYVNNDPHQIYHNSSANWGSLFNSPSIYQTIIWSLRLEKRPALYYKSYNRWRDPFREDVFYSDEELPFVNSIIEEHTKHAYDALVEADILIFTVGLNEVFRFIPLNYYLHRTPWNLNPSIWSASILSVQENVDFLRNAIIELRKVNPKIKVICTVSPVPLGRTFREMHVAPATGHSKATLRVALDQLCSELNDVYYLPSFETVMYPGKIEAWENDERHVSSNVIEKIMSLTIRQFGKISVWEEHVIKNKRSNINYKYYSQPEIEIFWEGLKSFESSGVIDKSSKSKIFDPFLFAFENQIEVPQIGYLAWRQLTTSTGVELNRWQSIQYKNINHNKNNGKIDSFLQSKYTELVNNGYCIIEPTFSSVELAKSLIENFNNGYATREIDKKYGILSALENENIPGAFRYFIDNSQIPRGKIINLYYQLGIVEIISKYLTNPIIKSIQSWKSLPSKSFNNNQESLAAQQFHIDIDNFAKWVNVFYFLEDVTTDNGPHVFVPGSHISLPKFFWRDGRFSDEEVLNNYKKPVELTVKAGSLLLVDTIGLHKGKTLINGKRFVIEGEFKESLFGSAFPVKSRKKYIDDLRKYDFDSSLIKFLLEYQ